MYFMFFDIMAVLIRMGVALTRYEGHFVGCGAGHLAVTELGFNIYEAFPYQGIELSGILGSLVI